MSMGNSSRRVLQSQPSNEQPLREAVGQHPAADPANMEVATTATSPIEEAAEDSSHPVSRATNPSDRPFEMAEEAEEGSDGSEEESDEEAGEIQQPNDTDVVDDDGEDPFLMVASMEALEGSPQFQEAMSRRRVLLQQILIRIKEAKQMVANTQWKNSMGAEHLRVLNEVEQVALFCVRSPAGLDPAEIDRGLRDFLERLEMIKAWPEAPLPIEGSPESGTCSYFEHPTEGRIRVKWTNPLPISSSGAPSYQCDVCLERCMAAWQHVTLGDERDSSTFMANRVGWDVCCPCFRATVTRERSALEAAARAAWVSEEPVSVTRSPLYSSHEIRFNSMTFTDQGTLQVVAQGTLTGEFLICVAMPEACVPDSWIYAQVYVLFDLKPFHGETPKCCICLDSLLDTSDGRIRPVVTKCGHYFHELCLRKALRGVEGMRGIQSCPLCRQENPLGPKAFVGGVSTVTFTLRHDCQGQPLSPGKPYLLLCLMAADKELPLDSYSCAIFQLFNSAQASSNPVPTSISKLSVPDP